MIKDLLEKLKEKSGYDGEVINYCTTEGAETTLVLVSGHSEENQNIERGGVTEHAYCYDIARLTFDLLVNHCNELNFNLFLLKRLKTDDWFEERLFTKFLINELTDGKGLDHQIHLNDGLNSRASGSLCFHYPGNEKGKIAAKEIVDSMKIFAGVPFCNYNNTGVTHCKDPGFPNMRYMLDGPDNTSILSELFFLKNSPDFENYTTPTAKERIAEAIAKAHLKTIHLFK